MTTAITTFFWCDQCEAITQSKRATKKCDKCKGSTVAVGFIENVVPE